MKHLKTYEKLTYFWYSKVIADKDVEYFYNMLKDTDILYRFYKINNNDESVIFKYILSSGEFQKNGWIIQQNDFFEKSGKYAYDPEIFIKEYNFQNDIKKYNL